MCSCEDGDFYLDMGTLSSLWGVQTETREGSCNELGFGF